VARVSKSLETPDLYYRHICDNGRNLRYNLQLHLNKNTCYLELTWTHSWTECLWRSSGLKLLISSQLLPTTNTIMEGKPWINQICKYDGEIRISSNKTGCQSSVLPSERWKWKQEETEALCDDVTKYRTQQAQATPSHPLKKHMFTAVPVYLQFVWLTVPNT
jgi:hypothetical protein